MKRYRWSILLGLTLLGTSALVYLAQVVLFHHPRDTVFYLLQDLAFLPVQVLLVTFVLNVLLTRRQRSELQNKLNMVIGAFFSEMGNALLRQCADFDRQADELRREMAISARWTDRDFALARRQAAAHQFSLDCSCPGLDDLKSLLLLHRPFMLRLLENSNLLEHETFTDLLWAVSHLTDELSFRRDLHDLPAADRAHLAGDLKRAFVLLLAEWLAYLRHLRDDYPYIYSLVVRMNPFNPDASPIIRQSEIPAP